MKGFDGIKLRVFAFFTLSMLFLVPLISVLTVFCRFKYFLEDSASIKALYIFIAVLCLVRFLCFGFLTDNLYDDMKEEQNKIYMAEIKQGKTYALSEFLKKLWGHDKHLD